MVFSGHRGLLEICALYRCQSVRQNCFGTWMFGYAWLVAVFTVPPELAIIKCTPGVDVTITY